MLRLIQIILFFFLTFISCFASHGFAQEDTSSAMSIAPENMQEKIIEMNLTIQMRVGYLGLNIFKAVLEGVSVCKDDPICLRHVNRIKRVQCVADVCNDTSKKQKPTDCLKEVREELPPEKLNELDSLICLLLKSPTVELIKTMTQIRGEFSEEFLYKSQAYLMALDGSAEKCEEHIKKFVDQSKSPWSMQWYKVLSGCRILARQSTLEEEEKKFYMWYGATTSWKCSNIINNDVRQACHNSDVSPVRLPQDQSTDNIETLVNHLYLKAFNSGLNADSWCGDDNQCRDLTNRTKPWLCLAYICSGRDNSTLPADCFKQSEQYYPHIDREKINESCALFKLWDEKNLQKVASYVSGVSMDDLVEFTAYVLALNYSADTCHKYIKKYVGQEAPLTYQWYRALSGCNILAGKFNLEQEEAGYYIWYAKDKRFSCSAIEDDVLKNACNASGVNSSAVIHEE